MKKTRIIYIVTALAISLSAYAGTEVTELRTLGLKNPLGIESTPSFSWKIKSTERGYTQSAYEINVSDAQGTTIWSSGRVESSRQTDIPFEGPALKSRTSYAWTVTSYTEKGGSATSKPATFETGILDQQEWSDAKWVAPKASPYKAIVEIMPKDGVVNSRYMKFEVTASGPHAAADPNFGFVQIAEVEIYNQAGENVARKATFTATNGWELENYGWSIRYINDGIIAGGSTNGFTTTQNTTTTTIVADLGEIEDVARIVIYPRQDAPAVNDNTQAANFPSNYKILLGTTESDYTLQYEAHQAKAPSYRNNTNVPYLGRNFELPAEKNVAQARIYASALGVFTMRLNGHRVTENVLEPGESAYNKHVLYSTYDVTSLLQTGSNTLVAQIAGGIANMSQMSDRFVKPELASNAATTSLRAMLWINFTDGTSLLVPTDENWGVLQSPTTGSNWYGGEDYDATREVSDIFTPGYNVGAWEKCEVVSPTFCAPSVSSSVMPIGEMHAREYEPLRIVETWPAVKVTRNAAGNYLVDFGQNFAGTYAFHLKAAKGTKITLYDSELQENDACKFEYMYEPSGASNKTLDTYIFKGADEGETWGPEFMYHGFRYLEINGLNEAPDPSAFTAKRIRSNIDVAGHFNTSNTLLNDIHTICFNGIQSQLYNTVTDCPHREKLGWLDVPNMMYQSLSFNFDVKSLLSKVVLDAFDSQGSNGYVPSTVPHFMKAYDDDLNWGGAAITIPYRNYKTYGDKRLMTQYYDQMKTLVNYYSSLADNGIIRNYSVLSDWGQETSGLTNPTSSSFTLTCTYYYLLNAMSEMAAVIDHPTDAETWKQMAQQVKETFNQRFFKDGVYEYGNQANYGMALFYGLVDEENITATSAALAEAVKASNYSIKTGEIGLRPTLMALAQNGYNDIVYRMANKTSYPSYGYWVKQGATTSLEYWDMSLSQNHCMMDHIEEWFYNQLGGISNTGEGYETLQLCPWIPVGLAMADISTETPRGLVRMAWNRAENFTTYAISIPAGSCAKVTLPIVKDKQLYENSHEISTLESITDVVYSDTLVCFTLGSGDYTFSMNASTLTDDISDETDSQDDDKQPEGEEVTEKYILNHGFEQRDTNAIPWAPTNWTLSFPDNNDNWGSLNTSDQRNVNPSEGSYDWHIWYGSDYISVRLFQKLRLPIGDYTLYGDLRCVDNAAITGQQRLFATPGADIISNTTIFSAPYNAEGDVNINNNDNENKKNWRTLMLTFNLTAESDVTIGYDCPRAEGEGRLGGFQVDNIRLFQKENATSVNNLKVSNSQSVEYYALSGQKLSMPSASKIVICKQGTQVYKIFKK